MKKLILLRGAPGVGKSTLLKEAGLDGYALSMDALRLLHSGPVLNMQGEWVVSQEHNKEVFQHFTKLLERRMTEGQTVVVDNTMADRQDIKHYIDLAKKHRYDIILVDFGAFPLEKALEQNRQRPVVKHVPERDIIKMHQRIADNPIISKQYPIQQISWAPGVNLAEQLQRALSLPIIDLSGYREVVHIGDLQGCLSVLTDKALPEGLKDDTYYVFVGDLLDRGLENGQVLRWFLGHACDRPNVTLLWGNHEDHLDRWAQGQPAVSDEFELGTLPQLIEAGLTPADAERVCRFAKPYFAYSWHDQYVQVCHGGLPTVPDRPELLSMLHLTKGVGAYQMDVDQAFDQNAPQGWTQVHGHRKPSHGKLHSKRSYSLEDSVEHGGRLPVLTLNQEGFHLATYSNDVFTPLRHRKPSMFERLPRAPWLTQPSDVTMSDDVWALMNAHPEVKSKASKSSPHIVSLNFSEQVFFEKSWDDVVVKARGLFVNTATKEIVARGYDKFFNVNEMPETQLSQLTKTLAFPVQMYVKENGFLGTLGYDQENQRMFLTSKSTPDSDFAQWFREIFEQTIPEPQRQLIERWVRDNEASLVFEVIDPVRDPHMIDYPEAKLVLLDAFHRSSTTRKLDYQDLQKLAQGVGLEVKRPGPRLTNGVALHKWHENSAHDLAYRYHGEDIEGFVLEDSQGFQTKVKLAHYAFWKTMRSQKSQMAKLIEERDALPQDSEIERYCEEVKQLKALLARPEATREERIAYGQELHRIQRFLKLERTRSDVEHDMTKLAKRFKHPLAQQFLTWAKDQPGAWLKSSSILEARKSFYGSSSFDPEALNVPWNPYGKNSDPEPDLVSSPKPMR